MSTNVKVYVRFKGNEDENHDPWDDWDVYDKQVKSKSRKREFAFDAIFDTSCLQLEMYERLAKGSISKAMDGWNITIFCYGQTGSGKTYTMFGPEDVTE